MFNELKKDFQLFINSLKKLKVNKFKLSIICVMMIFSNILSLLNPLLFGNIINGIVDKSIDSIYINVLLMCSVYFISIIIDYIYNMMLLKLTTHMEISMKENIFSSILNMSYTDFINYDKGQLINNIEIDSNVFSTLILNNINVVLSVLNMFVSIVLMIYISPILTVVIFLTVPVTGLVYLISGKKIKHKDIEYKSNHDLFISFLNETMYGWKFLSLFNASNKRNQSFKETTMNLYYIVVKKFKIQTLSNSLINIVSFLVNVFNILIGVYLIFNNKLTLGMFTAFTDYAERFKISSLSLTQLNSIIQETSVSLSRVSDVVNQAELIENNSFLYPKLNNEVREISIHNLSYATNNKHIFIDANLKFNSNNIYIIRGESGSGKSTLLNILGKFIDNYTGDVFLNDISLKNIDKQMCRDKISYITQENYLFSLSIKDNISLYRDIDLEDMIEACKLLKIHDTIQLLPNKYDTIINKNGSDLSGGERQRLCIARAIVSNPDVYLFDEITSAVDNENIKEIIKIIEYISKDKIVILTSHDNLEFSSPIIEYHLINKAFQIKEKYIAT